MITQSKIIGISEKYRTKSREKYLETLENDLIEQGKRLKPISKMILAGGKA